MLVIGFVDGKNHTFSSDLDVDPDIDSPRKIHDQLVKAASNISSFTTIICVEDDDVVAHFLLDEDFDLEEDTDDFSDDVDVDLDNLKDDDDDGFDDEDDEEEE